MGIAAVAAAAIPEIAVIPEIAAVAALPEIAGVAGLAGTIAGTIGETAGLGLGEALPAVAGLAETAITPETSSVAGLLGPEAVSGGSDLVDPSLLGTPQPGGGETVLSGLKATGGPLDSTLGSATLPTSPGPVAASPTAPASVPVSPTTSGTLGDVGSLDSARLADTATFPTTSDAGTLPGTVSTGTGAPPGATTPTDFGPASSPTSEPGFGGTGSTPGSSTIGSGTDFGSAASTASKGTSLLGEAGDFLKKNPSALLSAGGMLFNYLNQPKFPSIGSSLGPLEASARQLSQQGSQLQSYLNSGTLPPGAQAGLDSAGEAAKAAIRSKYAAMGGGAETSSAALADIANVDVVKQTQGANLALQLLQQGVSETQLSNQLYTEILNATLANDQALSTGISNFASSLVQPKITLNTGSATTSSS